MSRSKKYYPKENVLIYFCLLVVITGSFGWIKINARIEPARIEAKRLSKFAPMREDPRYREMIRLQDSFVATAKLVKPMAVGINRLVPVEKRGEYSLMTKDNSILGKVRSWWYRLSSLQYELEYGGSGILMNSKGYILTNYHIVKESNQIIVKFSDGRDFRARVIQGDSKSDLAVIKVYSFESFDTPKFGDSDSLEIGAWVMAIGNPFGLSSTVTVGVVSGKNNINLGSKYLTKSILTDLAINPGNSGGPLANLKGEIIAINSVMETNSGVIGFSKPIKDALRIGEELIENGRVERGWLGVGVQSLTSVLAESFNFPSGKTGVIINYLEENSPAEKGGLLQGDIIVKFNGQNIQGIDSLSIWVSRAKKEKSSITIFRNKEFKELEILLESHDPRLALNLEESEKIKNLL
jgi:serine protease Do